MRFDKMAGRLQLLKLWLEFDFDFAQKNAHTNTKRDSPLEEGTAAMLFFRDFL